MKEYEIQAYTVIGLFIGTFVALGIVIRILTLPSRSLKFKPTREYRIVAFGDRFIVETKNTFFNRWVHVVVANDKYIVGDTVEKTKALLDQQFKEYDNPTQPEIYHYTTNQALTNLK